jgi:hypothetical protein
MEKSGIKATPNENVYSIPLWCGACARQRWMKEGENVAVTSHVFVYPFCTHTLLLLLFIYILD